MFNAKDEMTKYSRVAPGINHEEVREKNEDSILEEEKLHEYAVEFWEKKKWGK